MTGGAMIPLGPVADPSAAFSYRFEVPPAFFEGAGYFCVDGVRQDGSVSVLPGDLGRVSFTAAVVPGVQDVAIHVPNAEGLAARPRVTTSGRIADGAGSDAGSARAVALDKSVFASFTDHLGADGAGGADANDFYRLDVAVSGTLRLGLASHAGNADLELLDSAGNLLGASGKIGSVEEVLRHGLAAGTYYARVFPAAGGDGYYTLAASMS